MFNFDKLSLCFCCAALCVFSVSNLDAQEGPDLSQEAGVISESEPGTLDIGESDRESGNSGPGTQIDRITVTAQYTEQVAQEVPISIRAFTGEALDQENILDFERVAARTPGLVVQQQTNSSPSFVVRGIEAANAGAAAESTLAIFFDGIDVSRSRGQLQELMDIERIEIVKGPQGTLFGRSSLIGGISTRSKRPNLRAEEIEAEFLGGKHELWGVTAIANIPIVENNLAFRLAARKRERNGFVDNIGAPNDPPLNDEDTRAIRGSLRYQPNDALRVDVIAYHQRDDSGEVVTKAIAVESPGGDLDPFGNAAQNPSPFPPVREINSIVVDSEWFISDFWRLQSLTGFRYVDFDNNFDADGTTFPFLSFDEFFRHDAISQEFRFFFDNGGRFTSIFGGSFMNDDISDSIGIRINEQFLLAGFPAIREPITEFPVAPGVTLPVTTGSGGFRTVNNKTNSFSLFANLRYDITDRLTLDTGLRGTSNDIDIGVTSTGMTADGVGSLAFPNGIFGDTAGQEFRTSESIEFVSPRAALSYALTDQFNVFAGVSRGVRSGFPDLAISNPAPGEIQATPDSIDDETLLSYEIGGKGTLWNKVYLEVAGYYFDYQDFQTLSEDFTEGLINAGEARAFGAELVASMDVTPDLSLTATYAYQDTEFEEFISGGQDLSGNEFRLAPPNTFSVSGFYNRKIAQNLALFSIANYSYRDDFFFNDTNLPTEQQDAFGLLDFRIGLETIDRDLRLELWAENVLNKKWIRDVGNAGSLFGVPTAIPANPRFWGVRVNYRF